MTINLNNPIAIGTMTEKRGDNGYYGFTRYGITESMEKFIAFCQYLIDSCPDVSAFVVVDISSQTVLRFDGLVFDTLGLKSKRYPRG